MCWLDEDDNVIKDCGECRCGNSSEKHTKPDITVDTSVDCRILDLPLLQCTVCNAYLNRHSKVK